MINLKITTNKIDKNRLFKGAKGTYLDLVVMELNEPDQYGNTHIVKQSCTKEERESGVKMPVIGNGKAFQKRGQSSGRSYQKPKSDNQDGPPESDDVPFN